MCVADYKCSADVRAKVRSDSELHRANFTQNQNANHDLYVSKLLVDTSPNTTVEMSCLGKRLRKEGERNSLELSCLLIRSAEYLKEDRKREE